MYILTTTGEKHTPHPYRTDQQADSQVFVESGVVHHRAIRNDPAVKPPMGCGVPQHNLGTPEPVTWQCILLLVSPSHSESWSGCSRLRDENDPQE